MKIKLSNIFITFGLALLVSACGGLPLVRPEGNVEQAAVTDEVIEGSASSPLATPVVTITPMQTDMPISETPIPPIATPFVPVATPILVTGTSTPAVKTSSDAPLLATEVLTQLGAKDKTSVWVEAWPASDEIILRVGYEPTSTFWAVSTAKLEASPISNYQPDKTSTTTAVEELRQYDPRVDYVHISPNGKWSAWGFGETLFIKQLDIENPPVNLLGKVQYEEFGHLTWSPTSEKIAYTVKNDPLGRYEIRISDPTGQEIKGIALSDTAPGYTAWSPDGQYLAFEMQEEPQSQVKNIYLIEHDGNGLTQLTGHGLAGGPIQWSPEGEAIAYTYGRGDGSQPWLVTITK